MQRVLPWLVAVAALAFAAWSWTAKRGPAPDLAGDHDVADHAATPEPSPEAAKASERPLRATRACLARLELAQAALDRCEGEGEKFEEEDAPACLSDPKAAAAVERRIAAAIERHVEGERARERRAAERLRAGFDEWSTQSLGILPHEREWLVEYVCAARELRSRTLDALDEVPPEQALEELREQRKQILEDLEHALGPDRYATLRTIGGIGLLADTTDCTAAGAEPG